MYRESTTRAVANPGRQDLNCGLVDGLTIESYQKMVLVPEPEPE